MTTPLLLSRTLDSTDYTHFEEELRIVDHYGIPGQHPHRRWEYALALHALDRYWKRGTDRFAGPLYDVGGAGSAFHEMLGEWVGGGEVVVIDPATPQGSTLEQYCTGGTPLADVVTCLSVIEHVADLDRFCYHLACLLAPGGLLVVTMDYWNRCGRDTAEHHRLRERIFCPQTYALLRRQFSTHHLTTFGGVDPTYHGPQVHDYTFASLVMEKRR